MLKKFNSVLKRLLGRGGTAIFTNQIEEYAEYDIGEGTYGRPQILRWDKETSLVVGKYCSIAKGVRIVLGGEHRTDWISTYPFNQFIPEAQSIKGHPRSKGDVIIGNDVWIGAGATILSGVIIGNGAVIGAGSVVKKPVDDFAIVAGNPAQLIRYRFPPEVITRLNRLAWWDWPAKEVRAAVSLLMSPNLTEFFSKYEANQGKLE